MQKLFNLISSLGENTIKLIHNVGLSFIMLYKSIIAKPDFRNNAPIVLQQINHQGMQSLWIIALSAFFIGLVLAIQGYTVLVNFNAESILGTMVTLSVLRELAPVITSLLFVGRSGSSITAEIGLMRSTEQLSSLEMMAVDPLRRVIAPRFFAAIISVPLLTIIFMALSIFGGVVVGIYIHNIDGSSFYSNILDNVKVSDIIKGILKSIIFVFIIAWVATYRGYYSTPGAKGISQATTSTVVISSVAILFTDLILTIFMFS